jgi:hypothetical protein
MLIIFCVMPISGAGEDDSDALSVETKCEIQNDELPKFSFDAETKEFSHYYNLVLYEICHLCIDLRITLPLVGLREYNV